MNFAQAQLEFQIRQYRWAKLKAAEEIKDEFPHFWLFKGGISWKFYQFMKQLGKDELNLFVAADLKKGHRDAAAALGEATTAEETRLMERYYAFRSFSAFEKELAKRKRLGEKVRFASKRSVQRAIVSRFNAAFGNMGLEGLDQADTTGANLRFGFQEWIVQTNFFFGPSENLIRFNHSVGHPISYSDPGVVKNPFLTFAACWIGLGIMQWAYLMQEDLDPACDSVISLCRDFFAQLPNFLEGLKVQNVILE